jgi:hypothetical protein
MRNRRRIRKEAPAAPAPGGFEPKIPWQSVEAVYIFSLELYNLNIILRGLMRKG